MVLIRQKYIQYFNKNINYILAIMVLNIFTVISCDHNNKNETENTTLKIKNESSKNIGNVLWNNINFKEDSLFIGSWNGNRTDSPVTRSVNIDIFGNNTYSVSFSAIGSTPTYYTDESFSGSWTLKENNTLTLINGGELLILSENRSTLKWHASSKKYTMRWWEFNYELLKSSTEDIKYGTSITKTVEHGSGYIFFTIGTIAYRTIDLIIVEKGIEKEFIFTNYTLVAKVTEPNNIKTLGEL